MFLLWWFKVCIRVSVRNISFQKVFGTQNLQEQLSYQVPLKMNSAFLLPFLAQLLACTYSNVDIYSLQSISCWIPKWKQLQTEYSTSVIEKPWALELKVTRPGYFSQWCDTHPHSCLFIFSSLLNSLSRIHLLNPSVPNQPKTYIGFFIIAGLASLLSLQKLLLAYKLKKINPYYKQKISCILLDCLIITVYFTLFWVLMQYSHNPFYSLKLWQNMGQKNIWLMNSVNLCGNQAL